MSLCKHVRLTRDSDPDYRYCIDCFHTIFIGTPMGHPSKDNDRDRSFCVDCGTQKTSNKGVRCKPCSSRYVGNLNKPKGHAPGAEIVLTPRVTDYVPGVGIG